MEHFKEGQYDDDLTQGSYDDDLTADINEYDDDFDTGDIDLFGFTDDEDSVLGRLKSIILSIEWEITNDILRQFNEELIELKNIWVGNKVNLIYVQALEKLSKYIYKEKSSAHPHAIKLLLTFYSNLERIVSDDSISDHEKKTILKSDIELFEKLKKQISQAIPAKSVVASADSESQSQDEIKEEPVSIPSKAVPVAEDSIVDAGDTRQDDPLLNLKAIVYGIDWEVTEHDLKSLSSEVKRLEDHFSDSKAKKIFLQGIGSLGSYIKLKRSDAHADAFKLLHSFFVGLETIVQNNLSGQAEKDVLLPQVEKFNVFKSIIADTISPERLSKSSADEEHSDDGFEDEEIQPAFADVPEDVQGFHIDQDDEQEDADEYLVDNGDDVGETAPATPADSALASEMESRLDGMFDEPPEEAALQLDKQKALQGVNVETEDDDDSEEEPLPEQDGELAPALAAEEPLPVEESPAVFTDKDDDLLDAAELAEPELLGSEVPGVDVEHEADDDSDEEPLPFDGDEYAPALSGNETEVEGKSKPEETEKGDIDSRLDDFFGDSTDEVAEEAEKVEIAESSAEEVEEEKIEPVTESDEISDRISDFFGDTAPDSAAGDMEKAIKGVDVETEDDDDSDEEPLPVDGDEFAPALSDGSEEDVAEKAEDEEKFIVEEQKDLSEDSLDIEKEDAGEDIDDRFDELFGEPEDGEGEPSLIESELEKENSLEMDDETSIGFDDDQHEQIETSASLDEFFTEEDVDSQVDLDQPILDDSEITSEEYAVTDTEIETEPGDGDDELAADAVSLQEEDLGTTSVSAYEEAGFEEIFDEEIEEFPEEILDDQEQAAPVETKPSSDEDEILAYFAEDDQGESDEAEVEDQPIAAFSDDDFEEDIPQMEVDDFATIIEDGRGVSAAGSVPSGYPSTDELLREFGDIAGDDLSEDEIHPEGDEDFIISVEEPDAVDYPEDEVVFQAVDEPLDSVEETKEKMEEDDTFGITLLDDEHYSTKAETDTPEDEIIPEVEETQEYARSSAYVKPQGDAPLHESLGGMRTCIASLGLEIDTEILESLNGEIEKLRHVWMDKPAEKTFIQLLSTVTSHINRYRYEADQEANKLLLSIFDKLELTALGDATENEIQEALLNETSKVLQWQAQLIDRTSTTEGIKEDKVQSIEYEDETTLLGETGSDEAFGTGLEDMSKKVDQIGDDMVMQRVSSIMKEELEQLKKDFQAELIELRKDILRGSGR